MSAANGTLGAHWKGAACCGRTTRSARSQSVAASRARLDVVAEEVFIRYGISSSVSCLLANAGLAVDVVRKSKAEHIAQLSSISLADARTAKRLLQRQPIDQDVADLLLQRSAFKCCCCHVR